jgi:hypothetical protein
MKKITLSILVALILISCGGVKTPSGEVDVYIPCQGSEFRTNKNYFRAFGSSVSNNPNGAIQDAEDMASGQLALDIERKVKVVTEKYSENVVDGMKGSFTSENERLIRQIAKQTLSKTKVICSKTTRDKNSGMYKHYTTIELAVEDIVKDYSDKIEDNTKSTIRINRDKFRAIFNEEIDKQ